jgi:hypothetical protein
MAASLSAYCHSIKYSILALVNAPIFVEIFGIITCIFSIKCISSCLSWVQRKERIARNKRIVNHRDADNRNNSPLEFQRALCSNNRSSVSNRRCYERSLKYCSFLVTEAELLW